MSLASDTFMGYEREFGSLSADLVRKVNSEIPSASGDKRRTLTKSAEKDLKDLKDLLEQMELDVREMPVNERTKAKQRVDRYKSEAERIERDLRKASIAFDGGSAARDELLRNDDLTTSRDQRETLLDNTERIERTGTRLQDGHKMLEDTQSVAIDLMGELQRQRTVISSSRQKTGEIDSSLDSSSRILKGMMRRIIQNKILMALIILILLGVIGLAVFLKYYNE